MERGSLLRADMSCQFWQKNNVLTTIAALSYSFHFLSNLSDKKISYLSDVNVISFFCFITHTLGKWANVLIHPFQPSLIFKGKDRRILLGLVNQGILKGKYPCTVDLLFDWFGLICFANKNKNCQLSYSWFQTSQNGGQRYSDSSPFRIPWVNLSLKKIRPRVKRPAIDKHSNLFG